MLLVLGLAGAVVLAPSAAGAATPDASVSFEPLEDLEPEPAVLATAPTISQPAASAVAPPRLAHPSHAPAAPPPVPPPER